MENEDFSPEVRRSAIWATDARKIASGRSYQLWLEKTGRADIPNLEGIEAVEMGKSLQEPIMRIAAQRWGLEFKDAPYARRHPVHEFMASHFDYIRADGRWLFEVKNYNDGHAKHFDAEANIVPNADRAQCLHEAIVHGVEGVSLIVLFGGHALQKFDLTFTDEERDSIIQAERDLWEKVQADVAPNPEHGEDAALRWKQHTPNKMLLASGALERKVAQLVDLKAAIKSMTDQADQIASEIKLAMQDAEALVDIEGRVLCTWKTAKGSNAFDERAFKEAYPQMYEQFVLPKPGTRRFLTK